MSEALLTMWLKGAYIPESC